VGVNGHVDDGPPRMQPAPSLLACTMSLKATSCVIWASWSGLVAGWRR
jgi:hypothetical protein